MSVLAIAGVALVFIPLLLGLYWALQPGFSSGAWAALLANNEWPQALRATLVSAALSTVLALLLAGGIASSTFPGRAWSALARRLVLLLSVPHAAFAVGLSFLIAPSGWLARLSAQFIGWAAPPAWVTVQDPYGLSLALALAFKESGFLLWMLVAILGEREIARQMTVARSLGYRRAQAWRQILWPQLLPRLGWPLAAVFAYGLSVVNMAVILGPGTPPTLAVLVWRWLNDASLELQSMGSAAIVVLVALLAVPACCARGAWRLAQGRRALPAGRRAPIEPAHDERSAWLPRVLLTVTWLVVGSLLLWSLAGAWFFPAVLPDALDPGAWLRADFSPFLNSLWLGMAACLVALPMTLAWLEWGPSRFTALLYAPLIVPALPLAAGQYSALLHTNLDGTSSGLLWSHLLWVLPYMVLTLIGPYRAVDGRFMTTARVLGHTRLRACLSVKWPMLVKPVLAALAVGFSVSIAQYLPTLFAGGGRFPTVTTEAVALSAGGNRRVLAVQALLQVLLPLAVFGLCGLLQRAFGRHRRGLR
ncbi:MAG: hypothetical protein QM739_19545 [Propionivibrio sp.]